MKTIPKVESQPYKETVFVTPKREFRSSSRNSIINDKSKSLQKKVTTSRNSSRNE